MWSIRTKFVDTYGADTMRLYEMFIGDFEKAAPWSPEVHQGLPPLPRACVGSGRKGAGGRRIL